MQVNASHRDWMLCDCGARRTCFHPTPTRWLGRRIRNPYVAGSRHRCPSHRRRGQGGICVARGGMRHLPDECLIVAGNAGLAIQPSPFTDVGAGTW
jgi:hypothetical protein